MNRQPAILDYAIIGNCRTAALIARDGSIDWLCLPRFDSPSVFAALLDRERGGCFAVTPVEEFSAARRYVPDTNVLQTTFDTAHGSVCLTDLMPCASEEEKRGMMWPDHELLRVVECTRGEVELKVRFDPRPLYGSVTPRLEKQGALGFTYSRGQSVFVLRAEVPLSSHRERGLEGRAVLKEGQRAYLSLSYSHGFPATIPPFGDFAAAKVKRTIDWWQSWAAQCRYKGQYRGQVVRSALALKLMSYAPSGAVIAAPTTSLPEALGGVRNWDYRFCWLRDASLTARALFELGFETEAHAFTSWLLHATRLTWPQLQVLYDVYGETKLPERELQHLRGYADSRPVRIGNAASDQFQLDIYGSVIDAAYRFVSRGGELDRATSRLLNGLGQTVARRWMEPDEGIWEVRSGPAHHTYSKAMCWVALERLLQLHERGQIKVPRIQLTRVRDEIRAVIETRGYSENVKSYVATLDGEQLDASLLQLAFTGYADARAPRMRSTVAAIRERLGRGALVYRYMMPDGLPPGEGAFGVCCFWAIDCLARQDEIEKAGALLEEMLGYANDVGLYAEEIDPDTGIGLGNFPQAFTHLGLINAAVTIAKATGRHPPKAQQRDRRTEGSHI